MSRVQGIRHHSQETSNASGGRALVATLLVGALVIAGTVIDVVHADVAHAAPARPSYYFCDNPHCYAIVDWPGNATGAETQMDVVSLYCNDFANCYGQTWHISDEF